MEYINQTINNLDFEAIQLYEVHTEICWASMGYINNYLEADHIILCLDENLRSYTEYEYYINQFIDIDPHNADGIDLGDADCLPEDIIYEINWFADGMRFDSLYDFWAGEEVRQHQHPDNGGLYIECRCDLSNKNIDMYRCKYMCWSDMFTFRYCNREDCGLCKYHGNAKFVNKEYLLYQKFVQPIE